MAEPNVFHRSPPGDAADYWRNDCEFPYPRSIGTEVNIETDDYRIVIKAAQVRGT